MSNRARLVPVLLALVLVGAALGVQSSRAAVSQTIYAYFDADGNLKFTYADGTSVGSTIPPGTYQVILDNNTADDLAVDHTFHLFGPGIDYTPAAGQVQTTFSVTFQANGTYTIQDDLHPTIGRRSFVATTAAATTSDTSTTSTSTSTGRTSTGSSSSTKSSSTATSNDVVGSALKSEPYRGALAGVVSAAGKLTLTRNGRGVSSLKVGRYRIAVDDKTPAGGFTLQEIRKQPVVLTGVSFVGKHTVTVVLRAGQWFFFSGKGAKSYFFVTS